MTLTDITLRYNISIFKDVILNKVNSKLPTEVIDMINTLANEVGAVDYIRIPKFLHGQRNNWSMINKEHNTHNTKRQRYKSRRNKEISSTKTVEDWNEIRNFAATQIKKQEGIDIHIANIRKYLNKITEQTYENIKENIEKEINKVIDFINNNQENEESLDKISGVFLSIANVNGYFSELYARIYSELMLKFDFFQTALMQNLTDADEIYKNIDSTNPDKDYERFCIINKENEQRRAMTKFYVNLMQQDTISKDVIMNILQNMQQRIINNAENSKEILIIQEITEIIYIIIEFGKSKLGKYNEWEDIVKNIEKVANTTSSAGISNKTIFKHMDMLDLITSI
jgi:hypothetical protein